jgi:hypothetical protein
MGAHPKESTPDRLHRLWGLNKEICRLHSAGLKGVQIAAELGITELTVTNTINSTVGREYLSSLEAQRNEELSKIRIRSTQIASKALDTLDGAIVDPTVPINQRIAASKAILGVAVPKEVDKTQTTTHTITTAQIEAMKVRAHESMSSLPPPDQEPQEAEVVEGDFTEEVPECAEEQG